jgi:tRNA G18 (ribose-2'-O)-methylase SpoU
MNPALDSLNVSVAGGMMLYEIARQREFDFES